MKDHIDKSRRLVGKSKVPVFDKYLGRKEETFSDRNLQDYDSSKKEKFFQKNLAVGVPSFQKRCGRNPEISSPKTVICDTVDHEKVHNAIQSKVKPRALNMVNLSRQLKRDPGAGYRTTEAYQNVMRDNERNELIRRLMITK